MINLKGILSYWVDKEKPTDGRTPGWPDGQADSSIPPDNFVVRYNNDIFFFLYIDNSNYKRALMHVIFKLITGLNQLFSTILQSLEYRLFERLFFTNAVLLT
jgi:hypothetical protein